QQDRVWFRLAVEEFGHHPPGEPLTAVWRRDGQLGHRVLLGREQVVGRQVLRAPPPLPVVEVSSEGEPGQRTIHSGRDEAEAGHLLVACQPGQQALGVGWSFVVRRLTVRVEVDLRDRVDVREQPRTEPLSYLDTRHVWRTTPPGGCPDAPSLCDSNDVAGVSR